MGLLGGGSSSTSNAPTTVSTGPGQAISGNNNLGASDGSIAVGSNSKYLEQGSTDKSHSNFQTWYNDNRKTETNTSVSDSGNTTNTTAVSDSGNSLTKTFLGGSDVSGNTGTVNITDNGAVQAATDLAGMALTDNSTAYAQALASLKDLATSTASTTNALAAQQSADLSKLLDSVNQSNTSAHDSLTNLTGGVLGSINQDLATAAAGTTATFQKTLLYVGLGLVAVLGIGFFFQRKHG